MFSRNPIETRRRGALLSTFGITLLTILCLCLSTAWAQDHDNDNPLDPANGDPDAPNANQLSQTQTAYIGARLLCGPDEASPRCSKASRGQVVFDRLEEGAYSDHDARDRYAFWEGDSLFVGVVDEDGGNRVDAIAEFYWFESSVERGSDFYVVVLKVASAPAPTTNWRIATPPSLADELLIRDIGPTQRVHAKTDRSGRFGAIRWDWSVPFQNYRWEPARTIEVEQEYTAGLNAEGTAMRSITEGVNVQAKGFVNANAKVSTRYTITLWRWEMRVQAGATGMTWDLVALDPEHERDPGYHEYFLVMQAPRGQQVRLEALDFASTFRNRRGGLLDYVVPDTFHDVSVKVADILLTPPQIANCPEGFAETDEGCIPLCEEGFKPLNGECVPDCPQGFIASGDNCVPDCQEGFEPNGNRCDPVCAMHERFYRGRCIPYCDEGERVEGDACVPICDEGERIDNGNCISVCRDGERFSNGRCHSVCERAEVWEDGRCVPGCDRGLILRDGRCVPDCQAGFHIEGDTCVPDCGPGYRAIGSRCVLDCPPGTYEQGGRCRRSTQCSEGTRLQNGQCIPLGGDNGLDGKTDGIQSASAEGGCSSLPSGSTPGGTSLLILAGLLLGLRRRR